LFWSERVNEILADPAYGQAAPTGRAARRPVARALDALTRDDLFKILTQPKNAPNARDPPAADEEDVVRVDLDELLMRVLAAALRRDVRDRALDDL